VFSDFSQAREKSLVKYERQRLADQQTEIDPKNTQDQKGERMSNLNVAMAEVLEIPKRRGDHGKGQ